MASSLSQLYEMARTEYEIESETLKEFVIKKAVQSVAFRLETPHARHQYLLTFSNQTLILESERDQPTIRIDSRLSFKTINEPWKLRVLDEEKPMLAPNQILDKVKKHYGP